MAKNVRVMQKFTRPPSEDEIDSYKLVRNETKRIVMVPTRDGLTDTYSLATLEKDEDGYLQVRVIARLVEPYVMVPSGEDEEKDISEKQYLN